MIPAWKNLAACAGSPPALFDPVHGDEAPRARDDRVRQAQSVCRSCVARFECLTEGVTGKESGVWGGVLLNYGKKVTPAAARRITAADLAPATRPLSLVRVS